MSGEEGSSKARTTRSGSKRATKAAVSGDEEYALTRRHRAPMEKSALRSCTTKRKAEESVRISRSKAAAQGAAAAKGDDEEVPAKKGRLPQEEIHRIIARDQDRDRLPIGIVDLKRRNPDLIPSPEEEMDEEMMDLYVEARVTYQVRERFPKFRAWVRSEHLKKGYVEVDNDILVGLEDTKAWEEELKGRLRRRKNLRQSKPHA
ncbi:hypothetical protein CFC21_019595 [Triticum aestivum]|uniref:Uncharacterized protein n=2 Tax=Triticum aestivum TaxID=4565 RepID=A0A9R1J4X7_WHEAT|nr:hypothetical protein CFC21_019585 [Triticum aestivum]KAF7004360.1 hypothetical protein CFC21_019595 [Triticum aestivum]